MNNVIFIFLVKYDLTDRELVSLHLCKYYRTYLYYITPNHILQSIYNNNPTQMQSEILHYEIDFYI